jgi:hypothetical protein
MQRSRVSIALATYNGERFIEEQLRSLAAQTRLPDEVVVSDDGSTDTTLAIVERFAAEAPFDVRVAPGTERLGVDANFARALAQCSGDFIAICDQDDRWLPHKIEHVLAAFQRAPAAQLVVNNQQIADERLQPTAFTTLENYERVHGTADAFGNGCCLTFRRSWLAAISPIAEGVSYDLWINSIAVSLGVRHMIREPLQLYRRHQGNASSATAFEARQLSRLDYYLGSPDADGRSLWEHQVQVAQLIIDHLRHNRDLFDQLADPAQVEAAIRSEQRRCEALKSRLAVRRRPRAGRVYAIFKMVRSGQYRHFSGLLSAAKDLVASS